jgi:hypothetical protein
MSHSERAGDDDQTPAPAELAAAPADQGTSGKEPETAPSLLELILAGGPPPLAARIDGVVIGHIADVDPSGAVSVTFAGAPAPGFPARSTAMILKEDEGREVALMFEQGDPRRPIVLGKMVSPLAAAPPEAAADGRRVEINAEEELVLRCGESSITLTRAGKIILHGAYVLSRSTGVNRIQGGSVEIN